MEYEYVEFWNPLNGAIKRKIKSRDVARAVMMAKFTDELDMSKPVMFEFFSYDASERWEHNRSGIYYLNCYPMTIDDLRKEGDHYQRFGIRRTLKIMEDRELKYAVAADKEILCELFREPFEPGEHLIRDDGTVIDHNGNQVMTIEWSRQ